jgi:hypothetical protein
VTEISFERPWDVNDVGHCIFYHTMELPGIGTVQGEWDLREGVAVYLGNMSFAGKTVLEVGPASGFVTFWMERMGARVTAVDVDDQTAWDCVPQHGLNAKQMIANRRSGMRLLKNGFWFAHRLHRSSARVLYSNVYDLPAGLDHFDVGVLALTLLHLRDPLSALTKCAEHVDALIVTELLSAELAREPVCRLLPTRQNGIWDTWWSISPAFIVQFLEVLGFQRIDISSHSALYRGAGFPLYTVVARR